MPEIDHDGLQPPDREQSLELLIEFTKDDDPRTRAMAVAGLAKTRSPRGFAPTLVTLFDPVDEVRAAAATALGIFGDPRAYEPLVQALEDPCVDVAVNCAWSLGQISDTRCLKMLFDLVQDEQTAIEIRRAAATAVGERSSLAGSDLATSDELIEQARVILLNALDNADDELRATCVWTLGHFPADKQTTLACIELLDDRYVWVVRYAIEALAHFGDLAALEPLEELADSEDESIRNLAVKAVEMLR